MNPSVFAKVSEIIAEQLQVDIATVKAGTQLSGLGADSMDMAEILMEVEDAFKIDIDDEAWKAWHTPADIVLFIEGNGVAS